MCLQFTMVVVWSEEAGWLLLEKTRSVPTFGVSNYDTYSARSPLECSSTENCTAASYNVCLNPRRPLLLHFRPILVTFSLSFNSLLRQFLQLRPTVLRSHSSSVNSSLEFSHRSDK
ncbi:hypothetical protein Pcinc_020911 [Petrolisthes cinctipes]|uniref:Uncharacterized protein n=1 Tax=Petrolisthes cinctipes TaxID=88211 RepID=A0AAE1FGX4_PETCI|nr:hypothetical protein Pcinc_020911 [Petrolisthes cinctipes]